MQTCVSKRELTDEEICGLQCVDPHFTNKEEMKKKHDDCTKKCLKRKREYPRPLGCFEDKVEERELKHFIGGQMTPEQCFE